MSSPNSEKVGTRRKGLTAGALLGIVAAMLVLVAFSAPLYRLFCAATGYNGTTQRATEIASEIVRDRTITIQFDANVAPGLDWQFYPEQRSVKVHPGETKVIHYRAANFSKQAETGTATFNVTPDKAGAYFAKIECFCFAEQTLEPGQSVDMPVTFYVDPAMLQDRGAAALGS